jgi:hypothetical protein
MSETRLKTSIVLDGSFHGVCVGRAASFHASWPTKMTARNESLTELSFLGAYPHKWAGPCKLNKLVHVQKGIDRHSSAIRSVHCRFGCSLMGKIANGTKKTTGKRKIFYFFES